ncbi:MAG: hypothetical protein EXR69_14160 [Myxococcales bacterium]|nr:hypothetical protein [Myxococcales bacterium]
MAPRLGTVRVLIEVPRGSHLKREWRTTAWGGRLVLEYISPVPSPFNYGCVLDRRADDGDPADAVVLGPQRAAGSEVIAAVRGVVRFTDAGCDDPKLICAGSPVDAVGRAQVERFFRRYAIARGWLNRMQGKSGETAFVGVEWG